MTTLANMLARMPRLSPPPVWRWMAVARERRRLAELSDHALGDIGITQTDARREAARPFWELPDRRAATRPARMPAGDRTRPVLNPGYPPEGDC